VGRRRMVDLSPAVGRRAEGGGQRSEGGEQMAEDRRQPSASWTAVAKRSGDTASAFRPPPSDSPSNS
jgi:hypothetical protein